MVDSQNNDESEAADIELVVELAQNFELVWNFESGQNFGSEEFDNSSQSLLLRGLTNDYLLDSNFLNSNWWFLEHFLIFEGYLPQLDMNLKYLLVSDRIYRLD